MINYRLDLEYDGTDFEGWQMQRDGHRTVQGCVSDALAALVGAPVTLYGAGRTDSGVHAEGQVAHVRLETRLGPDALREGLNSSLPADVAVRCVTAVPDSFDARRGARSKLYRYRIWNRPVRSPLHARRAWWLRVPLDVEAMRCASRALVGEHDFASFRAAGSGVRTTVRTLTALTIDTEPDGELTLDFEGDGFLRHMVRILVGTLVDVGRGRLGAGAIPEILAARDRSTAGPTAPGCGLTLVFVRYDEEPAAERARAERIQAERSSRRR